MLCLAWSLISAPGSQHWAQASVSGPSLSATVCWLVAGSLVSQAQICELPAFLLAPSLLPPQIFLMGLLSGGQGWLWVQPPPESEAPVHIMPHPCPALRPHTWPVLKPHCRTLFDPAAQQSWAQAAISRRKRRSDTRSKTDKLVKVKGKTQA